MVFRAIVAIVVVALISGCFDSTGLGTSLTDMRDMLFEIAEIICIFVTAVFQIAGVIGSIILVIAGLKWISSQDNPTEKKSAKDMIVAVIVGLLLIFLAKALVSTIMQQAFACSASGVTHLNLPI